MKNYKEVEVTGKRVKNGKTWNWIYTFKLNDEILATKSYSMKQNRLEQLAFNLCLEINY